ncbi:hypothetical protein ACHAPJ_009438 [Fusarium lateritium]
MLHCDYIPSRRGRKTAFRFNGASHIPFLASNPSSPPIDIIQSPFVPLSDPLSEAVFPIRFDGGSDISNTTGPRTASENNSARIDKVDLTLSNTCFTPNSDPMGWMHIYYAKFHRAHSFLPPMSSMFLFNPPNYLLKTMEFAVMHYSSVLPMDDQLRYMSGLVVDAEHSLPRVQALIILSILAHSTGQAKLAREFLEAAVHSAMEIHLNQKEFVFPTEGGGKNIFQESARRTWWQLFVLDTLLAALQAGGTLVIKTNQPEVLLPEEDYLFEDTSCVLSNDSIYDLDSRLLSGEDRTYPSFAYLVEACLIFRDVLVQIRCPNTVSPGDHQALDSRVALWFNLLPEEKRQVVKFDGSTDETMFQAHLIAHCARIYLNLPYSCLMSPMTHMRRIICSEPGIEFPSPRGALHTFKVLHAARGITELASLPVSLNSHTPFFICFVVLSSVVHVGACFALQNEVKESHRHHLGLNLSALDEMGKVWSLASLSKVHIRQAAQDALSFRQSIDSILDVE